MKGAMIFGLVTGTCLGAVVATMYKPAREAVQRGTKLVKQKAKNMTNQVK